MTESMDSKNNPAGGARRSATVRLEDVAVAAEVSRTSVSRVMLGQGKVSDKTRQRVLQVAEELGYVANVSARELASGGSSTVGLLLRAASNPAYGLLFSELQEAAHEKGITLISMTISDDNQAKKQVDSLHRLVGMRVAGLIVATGDITSEQLEPFRTQMPIIRAARPDMSGLIHSVSYDHDDAGRRLAEHLLGLGHNKVIVQVADASYSLPEHLRSSAMVRTLQEHGATVHRLDYHRGMDVHEPTIDLVKQGKATAIMVPQDLRQLELVRRLRAAGLSCPDDVSTTGCDGVLPGGDMLGLTTVRNAVEEVAQLLICYMADLINVESAPQVMPESGIIQDFVPGTLLPGHTAGPVPS